MTGSRTLGSRIASRRKELGLDQAELASMILSAENDRPISVQYLNEIEAGRHNPLSVALIRQLAKALKDDPEYLLYLIGASSGGARKGNGEPTAQLVPLLPPAHVPTPGQARRSAPSGRRPPSPEAMTEAKGRLENFSLSRFQNGSLPANYIPADNDLPPAFADQAGRVHEFQRGRIKEHLGKLAEAHEAHVRKRGRAPAAGMTVAIHKERIASVLPSYHEGKRTVDLGELMGLVGRQASGTEFYADGHPTLKRLALKARVNGFRSKLGVHQHGRKGGDKK